MNNGNKPTFLARRWEELLDITICTAGLVDEVRDWKVSKGSDHSLSTSGKTEQVLRRNPEDTNSKGDKEEPLLIIQDLSNNSRSKVAAEVSQKQSSKPLEPIVECKLGRDSKGQLVELVE